MSRLPLTSRDLASLRIAEQRARRARPELSPGPVVPAGPSTPRRLLRKLWDWLEQPEAQAPPSRPVVTNFYTEL